MNIKHRWHKEHFILKDAKDNAHPNRRVFVRKRDTPSLKAFARALLAQGDADAQAWFDNKHELNAQKRSDHNVKMAELCRAATKLNRKKGK